MKAACSHCGMEHLLKDAEVAAHSKVQFQCSKCRQTTLVEITLRPDQTMVISPLPSFARGNASASSLNFLQQDDGLKLPAAKSAVLTVVSGPSKGAVHNLKKPRVILGREDANIVLNDQEISRHHCLLEVRESYANLKDLDSTDGTWFERRWTNYADQKNYAAECASGDWISSMDADEELSSPLQTSLLSWKKHTPEYCVYEASRKAFYLGAWIEHSGWYPGFQRRLYRRNEAEFSGILHESLRYAGKVGRLSADLFHSTVPPFEDPD